MPQEVQKRKKTFSERGNASFTGFFAKLTAFLELAKSETFLPCVPAIQPDLSLLENLKSHEDRRAFISSLQLDKVPVKEAGQWSECEETDVFSKVTDLYTMMAGQID